MPLKFRLTLDSRTSRDGPLRVEAFLQGQGTLMENIVRYGPEGHQPTKCMHLLMFGSQQRSSDSMPHRVYKEEDMLEELTNMLWDALFRVNFDDVRSFECNFTAGHEEAVLRGNGDELKALIRSMTELEDAGKISTAWMPGYGRVQVRKDSSSSLYGLRWKDIGEEEGKEMCLGIRQWFSFADCMGFFLMNG